MKVVLDIRFVDKESQPLGSATVQLPGKMALFVALLFGPATGVTGWLSSEALQALLTSLASS